MNDDQRRSERPPEPTPDPSSLAELRAECERLRQRVRELEEASQREADLRAMLFAELRELQRPIYEWARQFCREEDWEDFKEEDYNIPLEEVLEELERQDGP